MLADKKREEEEEEEEAARLAGRGRRLPEQTQRDRLWAPSAAPDDATVADLMSSQIR